MGSTAGAALPHIGQIALLRGYRYSQEVQVMGSSLTGLDTSFSSGREFWFSRQLDCSQPGGRVPVTEVMSVGAGRRERQKTGGMDFRSKGVILGAAPRPR
jgi:hypothetical protein